MYEIYSVLFASAILSCAQCIPLNATHSESSSSSQLHLLVNNKTESTSYHLTPVMSELENMDQQIDDQLKTILPYLNFFFDSLLGTKSIDDDDCINEMVIQLVPDETAMPPKSNEKADEKEDKSNDKPDVTSTPEKPVDNSQTNP